MCAASLTYGTFTTLSVRHVGHLVDTSSCYILPVVQLVYRIPVLLSGLHGGTEVAYRLGDHTLCKTMW